MPAVCIRRCSKYYRKQCENNRWRNWCDRGGQINATATAGGVGSASITITVIDATDVSDPANPKLAGNVTIGGTSVTVANPSNNTSNSGSSSNTTVRPAPNPEPQEDPRSKDNNLKSLSVSAGTLSPKFSAGTTSYKVNLPANATSIEVNASANDSKASVSGTGKKKVEPGEK